MLFNLFRPRPTAPDTDLALQARVAELENRLNQAIKHQTPPALTHPTEHPRKRPVPLLPGESIRVLFVAQHPSIWPGWRSVHRAMSEHPGVSVKIVLAPFIHGAVSVITTLCNMQDCLVNEGVSFVTTSYLNLEELNPHVIFLQNPYDDTRPDFLKSSSLVSSGARIAYIPYGLETGGGAWNLRAQFDLQLQRTAWRIFARSERHKKLYATYNAAGNSNVIVTGHPKFDSYAQDITTSLPTELTAKIGSRKVVLWTPHFTVADTPCWSTYRLYADAIFSVFSGNTDLFLLLRPHPLFFKSMALHAVWDQDGEALFRKKLEESPNMALEEAADYHAAFAASHALMTDVGSFLLEYLPTGKPLLYLHHPRGLGMNDEEELTRSLYRACSASDIETFLHMIEKGEDPRKALRESVVPQYLSGLDDNIGKRICDAVVAGITTGDDSSPGPMQNDGQWQKDMARMWRNYSIPAEAAAQYQAEKIQAIGNFLHAQPIINNVIDMGCGDGKLTLEIARRTKTVMAFDHDRDAIDAAKKAAIESGSNNITFSPHEFYDVIPFDKFDLVTCLDVTRFIIEDARVLPFLKKLRALAHTDAQLLVTEVLSLAREQRVQSPEEGPARLRLIDDFRWALTRAGFVIEHETLVSTFEEDLVSKLFVLRPTPTY